MRIVKHHMRIVEHHIGTDSVHFLLSLYTFGNIVVQDGEAGFNFPSKK